MAHGEDPNSATTSFFLMLAASPALDGQFSAFGRIVEGLDVLDAFAKEEVDGEAPKRRLEIVGNGRQHKSSFLEMVFDTTLHVIKSN